MVKESTGQTRHLHAGLVSWSSSILLQLCEEGHFYGSMQNLPFLNRKHDGFFLTQSLFLGLLFLLEQKLSYGSLQFSQSSSRQFVPRCLSFAVFNRAFAATNLALPDCWGWSSSSPLSSRPWSFSPTAEPLWACRFRTVHQTGARREAHVTQDDVKFTLVTETGKYLL